MLSVYVGLAWSRIIGHLCKTTKAKEFRILERMAILTFPGDGPSLKKRGPKPLTVPARIAVTMWAEAIERLTRPATPPRPEPRRRPPRLTPYEVEKAKVTILKGGLITSYPFD